MEAARKVTTDIDILPTYFPIPGFGLVPVNAFVIKAKEPVLVDTGLIVESDDFVAKLESVINPEDLRWIYLTHPDFDHIGSLMRLMDRLPNVRLITTFLGYGILGLSARPPALDRVYLLNPGESLDLGDRQITVMKPPTFDNPATTGFFESKSRTLFSSDCFGALVQAPAETAADIKQAERQQGQVLWATVDSPWLHKVDRGLLAAELNGIREMAPDMVLSSHLPPAPAAVTEDLLNTIAASADAPQFVGPNQQALEAMLAQMTGGSHSA